jgi:hypothetical protein
MDLLTKDEIENPNRTVERILEHLVMVRNHPSIRLTTLKNRLIIERNYADGQLAILAREMIRERLRADAQKYKPVLGEEFLELYHETGVGAGRRGSNSIAQQVDGEHKTIGFLTSNATKLYGILRLRRRLAEGNALIALPRDTFLSSTPDLSDEKIRAEFKKEFQWMEINGADLAKKTKTKCSGKRRGTDDIMLCCMICDAEFCRNSNAEERELYEQVLYGTD